MLVRVSCPKGVPSTFLSQPRLSNPRIIKEPWATKKGKHQTFPKKSKSNKNRLRSIQQVRKIKNYLKTSPAFQKKMNENQNIVNFEAQFKKANNQSNQFLKKAKQKPKTSKNPRKQKTND